MPINSPDNGRPPPPDFAFCFHLHIKCSQSRLSVRFQVNTPERMKGSRREVEPRRTAGGNWVPSPQHSVCWQTSRNQFSQGTYCDFCKPGLPKLVSMAHSGKSQQEKMGRRKLESNMSLPWVSEMASEPTAEPAGPWLALIWGKATSSVGAGTSTSSTSRAAFLELKTHRCQSDCHSAWKDHSPVGNTPNTYL